MVRVSTRLEHVVARNTARLRDEHAWTQAEMARQMQLGGMRWTPNRVAQVETLRRPVTLLEMVALAWVFDVGAAELLAGDDDVDLEVDGRTAPLAEVRAALEGSVNEYRNARAVAASSSPDPQMTTYWVRQEELRRLGRRVGLDGRALGWVAVQLYGRDLFDERDSRVGPPDGAAPQSLRSKRGHATRRLLAEVTDYVNGKGFDTLMSQYEREHADGLESARRQLLGHDD